MYFIYIYLFINKLEILCNFLHNIMLFYMLNNICIYIQYKLLKNIFNKEINKTLIYILIIINYNIFKILIDL